MKRAVFTIVILTLFLIAMETQVTNLASANFFPAPGPDLPRIYIRANGSVDPATAPIERAGNTYILTDDISMHTIVIQRDNIVLDGSGYLLEGNKSWMGLAPRWGDSGNNGIIITGRNHVNITNMIFEGFTAGLRIQGSSHINIVGNRFNELKAVFDTPMAIVAEASSTVLIENNNFTKTNGPAIACNGTNIIIKENTLTEISDGVDGSIAIYGASNTIIDNRILTTSVSIRLGLANVNIIARNHITGSIAFVSGSNNQIFQNNLTSVRLIFSSNNTFFGNVISNNSPYDSIALDQGASNNVFYANTIPANCTIRFQDAGTTFWDNGTIGNYWADYTGVDNNLDGIGDTPYIIIGTKWDNQVNGDVNLPIGQDNHPLMAPYDFENEAVILPQNMTLIALLIAFGIGGVVGAGLLLYRRKRQHKGKQA